VPAGTGVAVIVGAGRLEQYNGELTVTVGFVFIVTVVEQVAVLPQASVAVNVTVVIPGL
jgi:hypothetical protein